MDLEQNNSLAKLPLLKQGEYDTLTQDRIIHQLHDYSLWRLKRKETQSRPVAKPLEKVQKSITSSSNSGSQNLAFVSGHSNTNDDNTAIVHVSTSSSPVSTASTNNSTACLSDATVYAYLATQPNGSQVVHEDLKQIHEDDLDEMDLKWQLALLSMKARKFYQRTSKKIVINGRDTAGYDKKKVKCFNCHKLGYFARECRNPKSQENRSQNSIQLKEEQ
ncbi:ribonuclease H-like domain-containing protein [Tanacetum coccineum]|uniref:Ribonuclease H-like domain-containing protein n=1 Tax=Tanacetum coccineum TaxID=301880 RepID=A0ABQ4Y800_9ASTR